MSDDLFEPTRVLSRVLPDGRRAAKLLESGLACGRFDVQITEGDELILVRDCQTGRENRFAWAGVTGTELLRRVHQWREEKV